MANRENMTAHEQNDEEMILLLSYQRVQPYQFEPTIPAVTVLSHSDSKSDISSEQSGSEPETENGRIGNTRWCQCGECMQIQTEKESCCCREIDLVASLREDLELGCITEHPGFEGNCLNDYVVETSFYEFLLNYGYVGDEEPVHELYRHVAYRRFTRWVWHRLGRGNCKVIPACAVNRIKQKWQSEHYTGFKYARDY